MNQPQTPNSSLAQHRQFQRIVRWFWCGFPSIFCICCVFCLIHIRFYSCWFSDNHDFCLHGKDFHTDDISISRCCVTVKAKWIYLFFTIIITQEMITAAFWAKIVSSLKDNASILFLFMTNVTDKEESGTAGKTMIRPTVFNWSATGWKKTKSSLVLRCHWPFKTGSCFFMTKAHPSRYG